MRLFLSHKPLIVSLINPGRLTSSVISFTLDSEPNEDPPEFTLTCRSEGGPATTVEWWRKGDLVQEDSNFMTSQIIVKKSVNTVYNNTLRVKGKKRGLYICTVNNNFHEFVTDSLPSLITTKFVLQGKFQITAYTIVSFTQLQRPQLDSMLPTYQIPLFY